MNSDVIERLSADDAAANVALSRAVGWKDAVGDWRVLHAAACVLGIRSAQGLMAQGALGDYGSAATLAKMVVAPECQGRGLGRRLLERLLRPAAERGIPVGLCATNEGRPLYEKAGFHVSGEIVILFGSPSAPAHEPVGVVPLSGAATAIQLERTLISCDRSRMLAARFAEADAAYGLDVGAGVGFALATAFEAGTVLGPLLASSEDGARQLVRAVFAAVPGPVRIDVPAEHVSFRSWLVGLGLRELAQRTEMALGAARVPWQVPARYALATQAWG